MFDHLSNLLSLVSDPLLVSRLVEVLMTLLLSARRNARPASRPRDEGDGERVLVVESSPRYRPAATEGPAERGLRTVVFVVSGDTMVIMSDDWLTTGETADLLGVSRQHVVNLCDRGRVRYRRTGTHRQIRRSDADALFPVSTLTREQARSLWLHRALLGPLMRDPDAVIGQARSAIERWLPGQRPDGMSARYLREWRRVLDDGVEEVARVLTGTDPQSCELRQNSPFAGILGPEERREVLGSFTAHWRREHPGS